jgi:hypothetical protein
VSEKDHQNTEPLKAPKKAKSKEFLEHMFKPGQSGNPGGRPRKLTDSLEKQLEQRVPNDPQKRSYAQLFIEAVMKRAIAKSDVLAKEIFDRIEGKVALPIVGEEEAGPLQINISAIPKYRKKV